MQLQSREALYFASVIAALKIRWDSNKALVLQNAWKENDERPDPNSTARADSVSNSKNSLFREVSAPTTTATYS
jgi:hypothetical protein